MRREVAKSEGFRPSINEFILITTAPDDAIIQQVARELEQETRDAGRDLKIAVWGWGRVQQEIVRFPEAIIAFHPDASPFTERLIGQVIGQVIEQGDQTKELLKQLFDEIPSAIVSSVRTQLATVDSSPAEAALNTHMHEEIDNYRDMINTGRPRTAIRLLTALQARLPATSSTRVRSRIIANVAVAHHRLCEFDTAAVLFAEAYELNPDDPTSIANKIVALRIQNKYGDAHSLALEAAKRFPDNSDIAVQRQSLGADENFENVWISLPATVVEKTAIRLCRILFLRDRQDAQWRSVLETAIQADADNRALLTLHAQDLLDRALAVDQSTLGAPASDSPNPAELARAALEFESLWVHSIGAELEPDWAAAHNGALAFSIIGDLKAAARLLDAALTRGTPVEESKRLRLSIFVRNGQHAEAITLSDSLESTPHNTLYRADLRVTSDPAAARQLLASRATYTEKRDIIAAAQIYIHSLLTEDKRGAAVVEANRLETVLPNEPLSAICLYIVHLAQGDPQAGAYLDEAVRRLMSRSLLNIAKRSLLRLMLSCVGLASKHAAG